MGQLRHFPVVGRLGRILQPCSSTRQHIGGVGLGFRVPGLLISPYAKKGFVDNQVLSHDCYNKFIEDVFLGSSRIPTVSGQPGPQRDKDENLGDLIYEFDFSTVRAPLPAMPCQ
jgi:phospholipase C